MRKHLKSQILKGTGRTMPQLETGRAAVDEMKRSDIFVIKVGTIGRGDDVFQFFFRKIGKVFLKDYQCTFLIGHAPHVANLIHRD